MDRCHVDEGLLEPLVTFDRDKVHAIDLPETELAFEDGFDGLLRVPVRDEGNVETVRHFELTVLGVLVLIIVLLGMESIFTIFMLCVINIT